MASNEEWLVPAGELNLENDEVHVWRADLDQVSEMLQDLLSEDEFRRACRLVRKEDQVRSMASRGILRELLGAYLRIHPATIKFQTNAFGKPSLAVPHAGSEIQFNVSHSQQLGLMAFARGRRLGVDIERIRPEVANDEIAERFFAAAESTHLRSLPQDQRSHAFFECWTRKEAYIKARGDGLSRALDSFEVAFGPGATPALLSSKEGVSEVARWKMVNLLPAVGFCGALVAEGPEIRIRQLRFSQ